MDQQMLEHQMQLAIAAHRADPSRTQASVAREYGVSRHTLSRRLAGAASRYDRKSSQRRLTEAEEAAMCRYIEQSELTSLAARKHFLSDAANAILLARGGSEAFAPVGPLWATRFLHRYKYATSEQKTPDNKDKGQQSNEEGAPAEQQQQQQQPREEDGSTPAATPTVPPTTPSRNTNTPEGKPIQRVGPQSGRLFPRETADELRQRLEKYQRDGILATLALHASARLITLENKCLRRLLAAKGVSDEEVSTYVETNGRGSTEQPAQDAPQDAPMDDAPPGGDNTNNTGEQPQASSGSAKPSSARVKKPRKKKTAPADGTGLDASQIAPTS